MEPSERPMKCWCWVRFASEVKLSRFTFQFDDMALKAHSLQWKTHSRVMTQSSWLHLSGQRRSTTDSSVQKFQHLTDRNWTHPAILKGPFWIVWQAPYNAHALSIRSAVEKKLWITCKSIPGPWKLSVLTKIDEVRWMDIPNLKDHGSIAAWSCRIGPSKPTKTGSEKITMDMYMWTNVPSLEVSGTLLFSSRPMKTFRTCGLNGLSKIYWTENEFEPVESSYERSDSESQLVCLGREEHDIHTFCHPHVALNLRNPWNRQSCV